MTAPSLPGGPLPANSVNEFGIATFAGMTESDWKAMQNGEWGGKFNPLGDLFGGLQELVNAVVAVFRGDWGPLRDLFSDIVDDFLDGDVLEKILSGITTGLSPALAALASLVGVKWETIEANTEAIAELAAIAPTSPVTPAYVADSQDMPTCPRQSCVTFVLASNTHNHDVTGSTANTNSAGNHLHAAGTLATANNTHTHTLTSRTAVFTPDVQKDPFGTGGKVYYAPIPVDRRGRLKYMHWIVGADSGLLPIVSYEIALCVYNPANSNIEKIWDSGNVASTLSSTTTQQEAEIDMGLDEAAGTCTPGQLLFVAHRQRANGLVQTPRSFAYGPAPAVARPASMLLRHASYITPDYYSGIPSSIALADLSGVDDRIPWAAVSVVTPEDEP